MVVIMVVGCHFEGDVQGDDGSGGSGSDKDGGGDVDGKRSCWRGDDVDGGDGGDGGVNGGAGGGGIGGDDGRRWWRRWRVWREKRETSIQWRMKPGVAQLAIAPIFRLWKAWS